MSKFIKPLIIKELGVSDYQAVCQAMQQFTATREHSTLDQVWLLQHPPIFTLGQAGKAEHVLAPADIPVLKSDRGGQVTYHGPGQLVAYVLLDIKRLGISVKCLVRHIEQTVIGLLADYGIQGIRKDKAPGVYVAGAKIAALGLRIRRGFCYHGLSFNVDMDLEPFQRINPCGYPNLAVTQLKDLGGPTDIVQVGHQFCEKLKQQFNYAKLEFQGSTL